MDHDHDHEDPDQDHGSMSMKMWFHFSEHATILFKEWHTMTAGELVGSCFAVAVLAALYEGLKVGRELLDKRMNAARTASDQSLASSKTRRCGHHRIFNRGHLLQTGLHFVQMWVSLSLMLVFMTYNVYLCMAVAIGGTIGYFGFAWAKEKNRFGYDTEMCH